MDQELIDKIAIDYADWYVKDDKISTVFSSKEKQHREEYLFMKLTLTWLKENGYIVVEKDKVIREYNISNGGMLKGEKTDDYDLRDYSIGRIAALKSIFGDELFKINE